MKENLNDTTNIYLTEKNETNIPKRKMVGEMRPKIMARLEAVKRKIGSVPEGFLSEGQHYPLCGVPVLIDSYCNGGLVV